MDHWKTSAGACIGGAVLGGALWWMINQSFMVNGAGLLERQGWPLNSVSLCVAAGALVGFVVGMVQSLKQQAHSRQLAELSHELGLDWSADVSLDNNWGLPLFQNWSNGRNRMSGERTGVPFQIFDFTTVHREGEQRRSTSRTVFLCEAAGLPEFTLCPQGLGLRLLGRAGVEGLTFDCARGLDPVESETVAQFSRQFHLKAIDVAKMIAIAVLSADEDSDNENAVRRLFSPRVMELFNKHPDYSLQAGQGFLAVWRGDRILPRRLRTELLTTALEIRSGLADGVRDSRDVAGLAPRPGAETGRQAVRFRNTLIGGVAGLFLGFFLGASGASAIFFRPAIGQPPGWDIVLVPVVFFGSVLLGGGLGAAVGSVVPVRLAKKLELTEKIDPNDIVTRRKATGIGVTAGLFLGFISGFLLFVALLRLFKLPDMPFWLNSMLFFACLGIGSVGGAVLGGRLAYRIFTRRAAARSQHRSDVE
ncbi:MAG: hypothetical protein NT069_22250 [Planctomycetota bacterium]|nr:hypothetical protein [Planctomycetota bacterium]